MTRSADEGSVVVAKTIEIKAGEPLVVPDEFQRALGLEQGGSYTVIQLDGLVIVTPRSLASLEALESIRRVLIEDNVTLDTLLSGLDTVREGIYRQHYGGSTEPA